MSEKIKNTEIKIENIETILLDVPTVRPHVLSMATMHKQSMLILRLTFSDGIVGLGEATTIGGLAYGPESPESIKVNLDTYFAPLLQSRTFSSSAEVMSLINKNIIGNNFAKCAVETALFDALGKRLGVPVSAFLGGRLHDRVPVLWVLASGDLKKDIAEAEDMLVQKRHNIFKIKIGKRSVEDDVKHVIAIKRSLGDQASIRVDVNQAWSRDQANRACAMLADGGIELVEQPLAFDDIHGATQLSQSARIAIMADESVQGPNSAQTLCTANAADAYSIKIAQSGGLTAARQVANIVSTSGAALYGGTMLESPIGCIASAHLFSTFENLEWGTELFSPLLLQEQFVNEALDYSNYSLGVPDAPGLGITLDEDKVKRFTRQ